MSSVRSNHYLFHRETQLNLDVIDVLVDAVEKLPTFETKQPPLDCVNKLFSFKSITDNLKLIDIKHAIDLVPNPDNAPIKKEKIEDALAELILYANYCAAYTTNSDTKNLTIYTKKFYVSFFNLKKLLGDNFDTTMQFICEKIEDPHLFLKIIPHICNVISEQEDELELSRDSEVSGHNIIYKIAKAISANKRHYKTVNIRHYVNNAIIESYIVNDIFIFKNSDDEPVERAKGLICSVLFPDYLPGTPISDSPVIYIAWAGTHNEATMAMNKERNAGTESFLNFEGQINKEIINVIESIYKKYNKPLEIRIVGHSLGGSLSQLCFHSLQLSLVKAIKDNLVLSGQHGEENKDFFEQFSLSKTQYFQELKEASTRFDLSKYKEIYAYNALNPNIVSRLHLGIWSDAGVIKAVENSSNSLCKLILRYSNTSLSAFFGWGKNDLIAKTGQGRILSDVRKNCVNNRKAEVHVMIINSGNKLGVIGLLGGTAALVASPFVGGTSLGLLAFGGILFGAGASAKTSYDEHVRKQFEKQGRPEDAYLTYNSKNANSAQVIENLLTAQHATVVDKFFDIVSQSVEPRINFEEKKHKEEFKKNLIGFVDHQSIIDYLNLEMKSNFPGKNICVMHAINYYRNLENIALRVDLLKFQDKNNKTLLHYAIENNNVALSFKLLDKRDINIDLQDSDGNTPLLLIMKKLNKLINNDEFYFLGSRLLELKADVTIENNKNESPISIFKTWKNWGAGQGQIFCKDMSFKLQNTPAAVMSSPALTNNNN